MKDSHKMLTFSSTSSTLSFKDFLMVWKVLECDRSSTFNKPTLSKLCNVKIC